MGSSGIGLIMGMGRRGIPSLQGISWSDTESLLVSKRSATCGGGSGALRPAKSGMKNTNREPSVPKGSPSNCAAWKTAWLANRPVCGRWIRHVRKRVYLEEGRVTPVMSPGASRLSETEALTRPRNGACSTDDLAWMYPGKHASSTACPQGCSGTPRQTRLGISRVSGGSVCEGFCQASSLSRVLCKMGSPCSGFLGRISPFMAFFSRRATLLISSFATLRALRRSPPAEQAVTV